MSKRFADNCKWTKPWFRQLNPAEKCAWYYITENCDNVGVWDADLKLANFAIGEDIDWKVFPDKCNGNIEILDNGKWFLVDFFVFQHGDFAIESKNKAHRSYVLLLKKHGLYERVFESLSRAQVEPNESPNRVPKAKAKERVRVKEQERDKDKEYAIGVKMTELEYEKLGDDFGENIRASAIDKLSDYKQATGKIYKSDYHAILNWVIREVSGKDKDTLKGEIVAKKEIEKKQEEINKDIESGKLEQRLTPEETREFISSIVKRPRPLKKQEDDTVPFFVEEGKEK